MRFGVCMTARPLSRRSPIYTHPNAVLYAHHKKTSIDYKGSTKTFVVSADPGTVNMHLFAHAIRWADIVALVTLLAAVVADARSWVSLDACHLSSEASVLFGAYHVVLATSACRILIGGHSHKIAYAVGNVVNAVARVATATVRLTMVPSLLQSYDASNAPPESAATGAPPRQHTPRVSAYLAARSDVVWVVTLCACAVSALLHCCRCRSRVIGRR